MVLPLLGGTGGEPLLHIEPLVIDRGGVEPLQELHRLLLIFRIAHHHHALEGMNAELSSRPLGQWCMHDVGLQLRALVGLVLVGLAQRFNVDGSAVQRGADRARQEGTVVVRVVPSKAALVVGLLPECGHELYRLDRLFRVEVDCLAVSLDFAATP